MSPERGRTGSLPVLQAVETVKNGWKCRHKGLLELPYTAAIRYDKTSTTTTRQNDIVGREILIEQSVWCLKHVAIETRGKNNIAKSIQAQNDIGYFDNRH